MNPNEYKNILNYMPMGNTNEKQNIRREIFNKEPNSGLFFQKFDDDKMKPLMFLMINFPLKFINKLSLPNFTFVPCVKLDFIQKSF